MPSVSEAQHNAMEAAAHGNSTLGIPRKVGEEFVAKDAKGNAAGVMFVAPDGDVLLMKRSADEKNFGGHWALPGGNVNEDEEPIAGALREAHEETGWKFSGKGVKVLDQRMTPTGMAFHTFAHPVSSKFAPTLNGEHTEYKWVALHDLPHPMHPGVVNTLRDRLLPEEDATDMSSEEWEQLRSGFAKWTREEEAEGEHAEDAQSRDGDGKFAESASSTEEHKAAEQHHREQADAHQRKGDQDGRMIHGSAAEGHKTAAAQPSEKNSATARDLSKSANAYRSKKAQDAKLSKEDVDYSPGKGDTRCKNCVHFSAGSCELVAGDIDPSYWCEKFKMKSAQDSKHRVALDKKSVRSYDQDGHLLVEMTPISKANVCPYRGEEIPGAEEMGLDPNETYMLLRDPEELAKAAPTAQGKPLLLIHIPVSADDHPREITVGSVAGEAEFKAPYLMAPLSVWDGEAIKLIESDKQRELSCAYHYVADMTPGEYEGEHYDGVMRDIKFNHVALVEEGRAGPDVIVGDSKLKEKDMSGSKTALSAAGSVAYGALMTHLRPRIAKDAKIDLRPVFKGVTGKNFKAEKPRIASDVKKLLPANKLAKDASLDDVTEFLDCLEKDVEGVDSLEPNAGTPMAGKPRGGEDEEDPKRKFLQEKLSAEDMAAYDAMEEGAEDEKEEDEEKKEGEDEEPKVMDKKAMDAAISGAVSKAVATERKRNHEINEAREFVTPWVGKIAMACDSAPAVYRAALGIMKVDVNGVHDDALKHVLAVQPKPNEARRSFAADAVPLAADSAPSGYGFGDMFPGAKPVAHA